MNSTRSMLRQLDPSAAQPGEARGPAARGEGGQPTEIIRLQRRGLMALGLGLASIMLAAWVVHQFAGIYDWGAEGDLVSSAIMVASLVMVLCARSNRFSHQLLLNFGAVYVVACAFGIEGLENITAWPVSGLVRGVPWTSMWIIFVPVLVPTNPVRACFVGAMSAATGPLALAVAVLMGRPAPSLLTVLSLLLPNLGAIVFATVTASLIYKLGTDVSRARRLGNYELVDRIGRGGMGEVWRAQHRLLSRQAAVKLIRSDMRADSGPEAQNRLRRFEREASATAMLRSPHTVQLYDFGAAPDGTLYYVMELLEGVDLDSLVRNVGPLPLGRAVYFIRQICSSLAEAHGLGLVHRDIKPGNIVACRLGTDFDFIKVLDFGLARPAHAATVPLEKLTVEGWVAGSPAYLAPEAILHGGEVDHRVDIYGLGCVAYWLLTGKLVFEGDSPIAIVQKHLHMTPPALSGSGGERIPAAVETVVLDCLAKDPAQRPRDAAIIAERLSGYEGDWNSTKACMWWREHTAAMAAADSPRHDTVPVQPATSAAGRPASRVEAQHG